MLTSLAPLQCRGRSFTPKESSPLTETVDWQMIKVQEIMMDGQRESGRIPRTVECELTCDLGNQGWSEGEGPGLVYG